MAKKTKKPKPSNKNASVLKRGPGSGPSNPQGYKKGVKAYARGGMVKC